MTEENFGPGPDDQGARSEDAVTEAQNIGEGDRFIDPQTGESFPTALPPERRPADPTIHLDEFGNRIPPNAPGYEHAGPYDFHSTAVRDHGAQRSAIQFIDVHKAFGRNKVLNGLNLDIPEDQISMILGPSGTGKSVCIKHMVGLLYPDQG
ncbi:MAG: ATP-binding cassette domain-containing protein, partial [Thermoleophilaceae bacterium]|nr:ATP-binding cassette domain-containing protein [Thermoleophilaceae bacterium]